MTTHTLCRVRYIGESGETEERSIPLPDRYAVRGRKLDMRAHDEITWQCGFTVVEVASRRLNHHESRARVRCSR